MRSDGDAVAVARRIDRRDRRRDRDRLRAEAADSIGGVRQQRSVFNQIIGVTLVIAVVVVALFFALLTVERIGLYGMLKAIGARSRTLFGGVVVQAVVVALIAAAIGSGFALFLDRALPPGTIPYQLLPGRLIVSSAALVVAAVVGSVFSLRRVLRVDPASAIGRTREQGRCAGTALGLGAQGVPHRRRGGHRARPRDAHHRSRRDRGARRPVRIGEDHALLDRRRDPGADGGQRRRRGRRHLRLLTEAAHRLPTRARRLRLPDRQSRAVPHRARELARDRRDRAPHRRPGPRRARTSSSRSSASPTAAATSPRRSREVSANGSRSAAR